MLQYSGRAEVENVECKGKKSRFVVDLTACEEYAGAGEVRGCR